MKKLLLLVGVVVAIGLRAPGLRSDIAPAVNAVLGRGVVQPVLEPLHRRSASSEIRQMLNRLEFHNATRPFLPSPARFSDYLVEYHLAKRGGMDPWGAPYVLRVTGDSVIVISAGRDGLLPSPDDLRAGFRRW